MCCKQAQPMWQPTQSKNGRRFDEEFRREVAALASRHGATVEQVGRGLGASAWNLLRCDGVVASMSRAGNCCDNAKMESFWATMKTEFIDGQVFTTRAEAKGARELSLSTAAVTFKAVDERGAEKIKVERNR